MITCSLQAQVRLSLTFSTRRTPASTLIPTLDGHSNSPATPGSNPHSREPSRFPTLIRYKAPLAHAPSPHWLIP
ncbi:hypothetical protein EXIGLDRAFT_162380 [Exidia glandulosa HHB12029]|uniref:Uncharacterized protein n=1 Tax=Exidia glandulosa HHB12029 TaxID=1314781 RepID=A0A165FG93_EXIGL|nr:hypothetical protein EXIGLDRAFT_162380 [Exidia glandulosa HHB12029]